MTDKLIEALERIADMRTAGGDLIEMHREELRGIAKTALAAHRSQQEAASDNAAFEKGYRQGRADQQQTYESRALAQQEAEQEPVADPDDGMLLDWLDDKNRRFKMGWKVGQAPAGNSVIFLGSNGPTPIREAIRAAIKAERGGA